MFWTVTVYAQEATFVPTNQKIQVSSKDGDYEQILKQIAEEIPQLSMSESMLGKRSGRDMDVKIVYTISEKGKTIYKSEALPARISTKSNNLVLFNNGLEESMINTWEKQGFIRRQVGRIEDPDAQTGTLPIPPKAGSGKTIPNQGEKSGGLSQPVGKVEKQGFIRRQVGRIPKTSYEINVQVQVPGQKGNSQPASFIVNII